MSVPSLQSIIDYCDRELDIAGVPDYPQALNGLQLANRSGEVTKIAAAVDACLPVVRESVRRGANLLIVHHGMFWNGAQPLRGSLYEKFRIAIEAGLAIYSVHIPLDIHPRLGNNARLVAELGLEDPEPFFEWKGIQL